MRFWDVVHAVLLMVGGDGGWAAENQPMPDAHAPGDDRAFRAGRHRRRHLRACRPTSRQALAKLVEAGRLMDALFLRQVWAGNEAVLFDLLADTTPLGRARLHAFLGQQGAVVAPRPQRAVPPRRAREARRRQLLSGRRDEGRTSRRGSRRCPTSRARAARPASSRPSAAGPTGQFRLVPYSVEYQGELARAAELLREAADADDRRRRSRSSSRPARDAFLSNDYYASDVAWMELDSAIEPTIGPYEVYEDEWFNYKAAFEAFITVRDAAESAKLDEVRERAAGHREPPADRPGAPQSRSSAAWRPIRVVNVVLAAGDGNRGVQTAAYNLPNDERVIREKGSKRVMLKNMQEAKFQKVLVPISKVVLSRGRPDAASRSTRSSRTS